MTSILGYLLGRVVKPRYLPRAVLSVRPSVTLISHAQSVQDIETHLNRTIQRWF